MAAADNPPDRVTERRRAVQLARHYRDAEDLSIAEIARRLGKSPATVKGYFYDPTGEKARAVKRRYQGACRNCGAPTQPRNRQGRRLRLLQEVPPRRHRAALDPRAGARCAARMARPLWEATVLV